MNSTSYRILGLLSEEEYLSGEILGRQLGISRMAVSKAVKRLAGLGVPIASVTGKGYRLEYPVQLLDKDYLKAYLNKQVLAGVTLHILDSVSSTSDYLLDLQPFHGVAGMVCLTERQGAGRGRRGRGWVSTPYRNVIMSIAWQFDNGLADLAGLGVAAGITIVNGLHRLGFDHQIGLKWPNDIVWMGRKLGGMLIDVRGQHDGPCTAVLGLGLNLSLIDSDAAMIEQPYATLESIHHEDVDRNEVIALLVGSLLDTFRNYSQSGFLPWQEQWHTHDRLIGKPVIVLQGDKEIYGRAAGINDQGALVLIKDDGNSEIYYSGEVSLRPA